MVELLDKRKIVEILQLLPNLRFDEIERFWVEVILERSQGNKQRAADTLGLTTYSIRRIINRWDIGCSLWEKDETK